jgi:plastocyanin
MRGLLHVTIALAAAAGLAGAAEMPTVTIDNFSFKPNELTVRAGTHVLFANHDDLPHSVVIPDLQQKSKLLDTDGSYEAVFDKPGTYKYFCGVHPMMTGTVTVTAE